MILSDTLSSVGFSSILSLNLLEKFSRPSCASTYIMETSGSMNVRLSLVPCFVISIFDITEFGPPRYVMLSILSITCTIASFALVQLSRRSFLLFVVSATIANLDFKSSEIPAIKWFSNLYPSPLISFGFLAIPSSKFNKSYNSLASFTDSSRPKQYAVFSISVFTEYKTGSIPFGDMSQFDLSSLPSCIAAQIVD